MIILKVRTSDGWESHKIVDFPCKIGRALDNDIIITDDSVSAHHAMVDMTADGFVLKDTGSTNGIVFKKKLQKEVIIHRTTEVLLGAVAIVLRSSQDLSEKTVNIHIRDLQRSSILEDHPIKVAIGAIIVTVLFAIFSGRVLEPVDKWSSIAGKEIGLLTVLLFAAAGFVVWSKIQNGRYRVWETLFLLYVVAFLFRLLITFGDFIIFNVNSDWFEILITGGGTLAILYFGIHAFSKVLYPLLNRIKRVVINVGILGAMIGLVYGVSLIEKVRSENAKMSNVIAYPVRSFVGEKYSFARLDSQFADLDKALDKQRIDMIEKNQGH